MNSIRYAPTLAVSGMLLTVVLLVAATAAPARAQDQITADWVGNGGAWSNALNWDCILGGCLPDNGGLHTWRVIISAGQLCNLDISPTVDQIDILFDGAGATLHQLNNRTLTIIGALDIPDPNRPTGVLSLDAATYVMSSGGNNTNLVFIDGPLIIGTAGQPGVIQMSNFSTNRIYAVTADESLLIGNNITIEGSGQIGLNRTSITNDGTIRAMQSVSMTIDPGAVAMVNTGTLRAENNATMVLNAGTYANTGGIIEALDGSFVNLNGAVIDGGTIQTAGTGVIQTAIVGTLDGSVNTVTNDGTINVLNNHDLMLRGTIANLGTINLNSTSATTELRCDGGEVILTGGGAVVMGDATTLNRINGFGGGFLTNVNNTIQGAGLLGNNTMAINNQSLIVANGTNDLSIDPDLGGLLNTGTLRADSGATLILLGGTFTNTGAAIEALDLSTVSMSNAVIVGGTLRTVGSGVIQTTGTETLDGTSQTVTIDGTFNVRNNDDLNLRGTITNLGTINLNSTGTTTQLRCDGGEVTLTGGGAVVMGDATTFNRINGFGGGSLTNVNNTIQGAGLLGNNTMAINNQALIVANGTGAATTLTIDPDLGGLLNTGTLRADSGATLILLGGTFTNTGAMIEALDLSTVSMSAAVIVGGTLRTVGSGVIQTTGIDTLDGTAQTVTIDGTINVRNNDDLFLRGTITNLGTINLNSTSATTELRCDGGEVTLTGNGTVTLGDAVAANEIDGINGGFLTNVNNTIQGAGAIGANTMAINNQSLIVANGTGVATTLTIDPSPAGLVNTGTLRAQDNATMVLVTGTYANTGGVIEALDGSIVRLSGAVIDGGTIQSAGTGVIQTSGVGTLDGLVNTVTTDGTIDVLNNADLNLRGTITNLGTISLSSTSATTQLRCDGGEVTLTGGGTVVMGDANSLNRIDGFGGGFLTNLNNTIQGAGLLGNNTMAINNQSLIVANGTNALTIYPDVNGMVNTGTLRADSGATLVLANRIFTNTGAVIEALDLSTVSMSNAVIVGGTLRTVGSGVIQTTGIETLDGTAQTVTVDGTFNVRNNHDLNLRGTITNLGTINLNSTGSNTELQADGGVVLLTGGGTVNMGDANTLNSINRINGGSLTNVDNTIRGAGMIGLNVLDVDNQSLIVADGINTLTLDPAAVFTNTGTLRAQNNATMVLATGTYANTGGVIEALDGSIVRLSGAIIDGGTIQTAGTGVIQTSGVGTLDGSVNTVTNDGTIDVLNNADLNLRGTIINAGTINLSSTGSNTELQADGGLVLLTGGGTVNMADANTLNSINQINGGSMINVDNTIQGAGNIGLNNMSFTNQGSVIANGANTLTIDPPAAGSFDNQGDVQVTGAGGLIITTGSFTTSGTVSIAAGTSLSRTGDYTQTGGSTMVDGTLSVTGVVDLQGGVFGGTGTVLGDLINTGASVGPGASAGTLTIMEDYIQGENATYAVEIGGLTQGVDYDWLNISGTADLAGLLSITIINDFVPMAGDIHQILTAAAVNGEFDQVTLNGVPADLLVKVVYSDTAVTVEVLEPAPGDCVIDGNIDLFDFQSFQSCVTGPDGGPLEDSCLCADFDEDDDVDLIDFREFQVAFTG